MAIQIRWPPHLFRLAHGPEHLRIFGLIQPDLNGQLELFLDPDLIVRKDGKTQRLQPVLSEKIVDNKKNACFKDLVERGNWANNRSGVAYRGFPLTVQNSHPSRTPNPTHRINTNLGVSHQGEIGEGKMIKIRQKLLSGV